MKETNHRDRCPLRARPAAQRQPRRRELR